MSPCKGCGGGNQNSDRLGRGDSMAYNAGSSYGNGTPPMEVFSRGMLQPNDITYTLSNPDFVLCKILFHVDGTINGSTGNVSITPCLIVTEIPVVPLDLVAGERRRIAA